MNLKWKRKTQKMKYKRRPRRLILGEEYYVKFNRGNTVLCKFIKPTAKGYNFLNIETSKCIFKRHVYPSKCENHKDGNFF